MKYSFSLCTTVICACLLMAVSGCATDDSYRREEVRSIKSDVNEQLTQVKSVSDEVKWQVDEANKRTEAVERELATLKRQIVENNKVIEQKLAELSGAIASVDGRRQKSDEELDRKIQVVLDEVSKENERILSKIEKQKSKAKKDGTKPKASVKEVPEKHTNTASAEGVHVVASGETLNKIARAYGISLNELMEMNGFDEAKPLKIGQKLKVPKKSE